MRIPPLFGLLVCGLLHMVPGVFAQEVSYVQVKTSNGLLEGVVSADGKVRTFKGIPYAAPPVGPLRWKPPQPAPAWKGVRKASEYGPRAMQGRIYDDMIFHDDGPSEDCLYLNLWMPAQPASPKLPVMVWLHGGGFIAGSSSEPRQDAGNLSKQGVLVVSLNYRMGVFGFLAHPELTAESEHQASGNYGLLDQVAALHWVKDNIATFGGDPDNVTIFGQSAGSSSVCGLMASPLARGLFQRAIGESGSFCNPAQPLKTRAVAEAAGVKFATAAFGTSSLEALRARPASEILEAALQLPHEYFRPIVDGWFLPADCPSIFAAGRQSHVPLLAGWNRDEGDFRWLFGKDEPGVENYVTHARAKFGGDAETFLQLYPATTPETVRRAAQDLAADRSPGYPMWKWLELQLKTGESPVFRYKYEQPLPLAADAAPGTEPMVPHSAEIEYVFQVLPARNLPWRAGDRTVSDLMAAYWTNFAKHGDPNGPGLPRWPAYSGESGYAVMHLRPSALAAPDEYRARYEFLDRVLPGL